MEIAFPYHTKKAILLPFLTASVWSNFGGKQTQKKGRDEEVGPHVAESTSQVSYMKLSITDTEKKNLE